MWSASGLLTNCETKEQGVPGAVAEPWMPHEQGPGQIPGPFACSPLPSRVPKVSFYELRLDGVSWSLPSGDSPKFAPAKRGYHLTLRGIPL
jgi:hypothetical protein